ncbi:hypothetical protein BSKO_00228 [Bryopsis sp. KO-2023]|nr:hypothetical protein BSKO_00228 [Bryopsis sp. KO-2023]
MDSLSNGARGGVLGGRIAAIAVAILVLAATVDARFLRAFQVPESRGVHSDGVLNYPISRDMGYNGDWNVLREEHGPQVIPEDGYLRYTEEDSTGDDGWVFVDLDPMLDSSGSSLTFKLRLNSMSGEEVQFTVLANLVLRIRDGGSYAEWARWNGQGFEKLADSGIRPGDQWHQILVHMSPNGFTLAENGEDLFHLEKQLYGGIDNTFHMSVVAAGTSVSMDLSDISATPPDWKMRLREGLLGGQNPGSNQGFFGWGGQNPGSNHAFFG